MDFAAAFGRDVRRRREALGITLDELAERAGISPNFLGAIELGKREPSLSTIVELAMGLGVTPGELLCGLDGLSLAAKLFEGPPPSDPPSSTPPRGGAPGARLPRPSEPHQPPLPSVVWNARRAVH
jgi:transcriptional regulator with XRE-family HTH domain